MGCDIHGPWIEYQEFEPTDIKPDRMWWPVAKLQLGQRNYAIFGLLAGVRGGTALVEPRGYPRHIGFELREHIENQGDYCHSASWLTLPEMVAVRKAWRQQIDDCNAMDKGSAEQDYPGSFLNLAISIMKFVEKKTGRSTRAVFCFDN